MDWRDDDFAKVLGCNASWDLGHRCCSRIDGVLLMIGLIAWWVRRVETHVLNPHRTDRWLPPVLKNRCCTDRLWRYAWRFPDSAPEGARLSKNSRCRLSGPAQSVRVAADNKMLLHRRQHAAGRLRTSVFGPYSTAHCSSSPRPERRRRQRRAEEAGQELMLQLDVTTN